MRNLLSFRSILTSIFILIFYISLISQVTSPPTLFKKAPVYKGVDGDKIVWNYFLYGSGGLINSATNDTNNTSPLNGSIAFGATNLVNNFIIGFTINNINAEEIISTENYGNALVIPELGGQSVTVQYSYFFDSKNNAFKRKFGVKTKIAMGLSKWIVAEEEFEAIPLLWQVLFSFQPFPGMKDIGTDVSNKLDLSFDIGFTSRNLLGGVTERKDLLLNNFGSNKKDFNGLHVGANFTINSLTVFGNFMQFFQDEGIEGLPKSEFTVGAVLSGNLIQLK